MIKPPPRWLTSLCIIADFILALVWVWLGHVAVALFFLLVAYILTLIGFRKNQS